jgi:sugar phosphate isomerase/epimerase
MIPLSRRAFLLATCAFLTARQKFSGTVGLEIYSLRGEAKKDLPAALAMIRKFGISEVEVPELYGRSAIEFRRLLDDGGLKATSMMADHDRLAKEIHSVADDVHALGAEYVVCSTIPHRHKHLAAEECNRAADDFGRWGKSLAGSGLHLCYHTHGIEFDTTPDGTLFDSLAKRTDSKFDPVKLLHKYPGRFPLMHIKDIRKDVVLGGSPGDVREEASVTLGKGLVDIPAVLSVAQATGVRHYYIEDEAVDAYGKPAISGEPSLMTLGSITRS